MKERASGLVDNKNDRPSRTPKLLFSGLLYTDHRSRYVPQRNYRDNRCDPSVFIGRARSHRNDGFLRSSGDLWIADIERFVADESYDSLCDAIDLSLCDASRAVQGQWFSRSRLNIQRKHVRVLP